MHTWRVDKSYEIAVESNAVRAWSTRRLPFEPKGWLKGYRDDLRIALRSLKPETGRHLRAVYASPDREFADVENVLLYNVGASSYRHLTDGGLEVQRVSSGDGLHHVSYQFVDSVERALTAGRTLATVTLHAMPSPTDRAGAWWAAIRPRVVIVDGELDVDQQFTVDVSMGGMGSSLVSVIKPLLDGLISALHVHDGTRRDHVRNALSRYGDADELWAGLVSSETAILGPRTLVRPHGGGIAWNPADDLCCAFLVKPANAGPALSATIRVAAC